MSDYSFVPEGVLRDSVFAALVRAGADEPSAAGTTRALMLASLIGIDSHGVRLVPHYAKMMRAGRVNPRPQRKIFRKATATALIDADNGLGHAAAYAAVKLAGDLARVHGIGAVGVFRSSHFAAAGAYALAGAEAGFITLVMTNADKIVALHGSARPFHGTNPIAVAAPVAGQKPWLMELATSSIPFNRVALYRLLGKTLPRGVAADATGTPTEDPDQAEMLLPLGGTDHGHKGAGLAGLVTVLSAVLTGGTLDHEMIPMFQTQDFSTPRNIGHFCLAMDPEHLVGRAAYDRAMIRYLESLRRVPGRPGEHVLAPGDREWQVEAERLRSGIPVDQETASYLRLAGSNPTYRDSDSFT